MAIQMRRGVYDDFDPSKMLAGEWAVVTSGDPNTVTGRAVYHCFAAGTVERVATYVEAREIIYNSLTEIEEALDEAVEAANDAAEAAGDAASAASDAASAASDAADAAQAIVDYSVPLMSASQRGGAKLGDGLAIDDDALTVDELTTAQIDSVVADTTVTSPKVLTGTRLTYLWDKIKAAFAAATHTHTKSDITDFAHTHTKSDVTDFAHTHTASDITSGTLPVAQGGTGATSAANARTNLDAAQSNGASNTLYAAEQAITGLAAAQGTVPSGKTLQGEIETLQDSVNLDGFVESVTYNCWRTDASNPGINVAWVLTNGTTFALSANGSTIALTYIDSQGTSATIWSK